MSRLEKILDWLAQPSSPSWARSSLAQMAMGSLLCYLIVAGKVAWQTGDLAPLKWAAEIFGASYLTARMTNGKPPAGAVPS